MKKEIMLPGGIDRSSLLRSDKNWIIDTLNGENSRIIPVHNSNVLCDNSNQSRPIYLTRKYLVDLSGPTEALMFLGVYDGTSYFATDIYSENLAEAVRQRTNGLFQNLRAVLSLLGNRDSQLLPLACFMTYWHQRNQYCGKCGSKTKSSEAGHVRVCRNEACKEYYFPSMDPAVIMLISSGQRCLLGRKKEWRKGMYSTLAGFVEPGETIEDAVVREVQEEVGIDIESVEYQHSQPWLFPSSLMLGFTARAKEETLRIDRNELEDACWFTRDEIRQNPHIMPYRVSISHKLIMEWLDAGD